MNDKIIGRNPVLEAIRSGRSVDKILVKRVSMRALLFRLSRKQRMQEL